MVGEDTAESIQKIVNVFGLLLTRIHRHVSLLSLPAQSLGLEHAQLEFLPRGKVGHQVVPGDLQADVRIFPA